MGTELGEAPSFPPLNSLVTLMTFDLIHVWRMLYGLVNVLRTAAGVRNFANLMKRNCSRQIAYVQLGWRGYTRYRGVGCQSGDYVGCHWLDFLH